MTSIPDSFNLDQLSAALENAPAEQEHHINEKASHLMNDEIWDLAHDEVMRTGKMTNNGPVFHKAIVMQILAKLQYFHTAMGDSIRENEAPEDVVNAWHRDAGKIQAAICILMTISVDDDDFYARRKLQVIISPLLQGGIFLFLPIFVSQKPAGPTLLLFNVSDVFTSAC